MGILRRREPSSPVLQALRWLCSINFGLPNHHTDLNKNGNLIGIFMVLIMNWVFTTNIASNDQKVGQNMEKLYIISEKKIV